MRLDTAPGVNVTLRVDGAPLMEYDDRSESDEALLESKYVEAIAGANFSIQFEAYIPRLGGCNKDSVHFSVSLDGKHAFTRILDVHSTNSMRYTCNFKGINHVMNGQYVMERFAFAELKTNDESVKDFTIAEFKGLGEVRIACTLVRPTSARAPVNWDTRFKASTETPIPEKCLKGRSISSQVALGKPELLGGMLEFVELDWPYGRTPFATYKFQHRSRRDLQIEGIIPRSPLPVPLEDKDPEELTLEEARELLRRSRAKNETNNNVKQENARIKSEKRDRATMIEDDDEDDDVIIIEEGRGRKRSRNSRDSAVEIIDLSDD